ncbi:MAG: 16S rRNA (cytidine(1402)-2'-O)-methyltransferase [Spirochaetaceae bacterium]|jgi:16S rRNA (cytidine1402-2'-O)-methyltransferase|nr:16S rRNA (cytidine(1402)-2'-O)-methyltransferase [Spirochaetaceae bacterium]
MGDLYIVATPIGNLEDMTFRAVEILKNVDIIACEDTRQSKKLLNHYGIGKHLISCRARNEVNSSAGIMKLLEEGKNIAYISDAGSPGISDPGSILVRSARDHGFNTIPIPGASAQTALASVSGFKGKSVLFEGFLAQKSGKRKKRLRELLDREEAFIVYESPYRIEKLMTELTELEPDRILLIGREMTKIHEQYVEGNSKTILEMLGKEVTIKGEFAILVSGK